MSYMVLFEQDTCKYVIVKDLELTSSFYYLIFKIVTYLCIAFKMYSRDINIYIYKKYTKIN